MRCANPSPLLLVGLLVLLSGFAPTAFAPGAQAAALAPDLSIDVQHTGAFIVGFPGSYTVVITNAGSASTVGGAVVMDTLPTGLDFTNVRGNGWAVMIAGQLLTATLSSALAPGDTSSLNLDVSVDASALPAVTNAATVRVVGDANTTNDRDTDLTAVTFPTPPPPPELPPLFLLKWGSGGGQGQLSSAFGVATDAGGNVYVADQVTRLIKKYTGTGNYLSAWGGNYGSGNGQFSQPIGLALDAAGAVYVADAMGYRVQKFSNAGIFLLKWGSPGAGDGQFQAPSGVATDAAGNVYVCDKILNRVQKFTSEGAFLARWGSTGAGDGQFSNCSGVAVDASGNVYVSDLGNSRIQKFNGTGTYLSQWGSAGAGDGQFNLPYAVATDAIGNVYVDDAANHRVQKFSSSGVYLTQWGSAGSGDGQFQGGGGMAVDAVGNIYVADGNRIQKFGPPRIATTIALSSSGNPGLPGNNVTLTATVNPPAATGSVTFTDNGYPLGVRPLVNGVATLPYHLGAFGERSLTATYSGDSLYSFSIASMTQVIGYGFPVTVAITPSANPVSGHLVTLAVSVTPAAATGAITITDNGAPYAYVPLVNGTASVPYHAAAFDVRTFVATYSGDSVYAYGSGQTAVTFVGRPVVVTLASRPNPAVRGLPDTLRATVTAVFLPPTPIGSVSFLDGATPMATLPLVAGSALLVWPFSTAGNHQLTAIYSGDTTFAKTTGSLSLDVNTTSQTATTLLSSAVSIVEGATVLFTAGVSPRTGVGNVLFYIDGVLQANVPITSGDPSFATSTLTAGTHQVFAAYLGTPEWSPSNSATLTEYVVGNQTPVLRVYAPNGGESFTLGAVSQIRWNAVDTHSASAVWIYVSRSVHPPVWEPIATNVPNTGSYLWTVTGPVTGDGAPPVNAALVAVVDQSGRVGGDASDLPFSISDAATEAALTRFDAEPSDAGIEVFWALANHAAYSDVTLQRSLLQDGPWVYVAAEARVEGDATVHNDTAVEAGVTYWYRLLTTAVGGAQSVFGPVVATAGAPKEFRLSGVWPNPSPAGVTLSFSVAQRAAVRLSLLDIAGREVKVLATGERAPGRYTLTWDGRDDRGPVAAGVYFVRYVVPGRSFVSRVAIVR